MKNSFNRSLCVACFLFVLNFGKAQPVITEFYVMKEAIKIDLTDKKIQKILNSKGILDMVWNTSSSMLAVTYDPKITESREVYRNVQELLGVNTSGIINQGANSK